MISLVNIWQSARVPPACSCTGKEEGWQNAGQVQVFTLGMCTATTQYCSMYSHLLMPVLQGMEMTAFLTK